MMKTWTLGLVAAGMLMSAPIAAQADESEQAAVQPAGETVSCIDTHRVRDTKVLDNQTVLFRMRGGPDYEMKLTRRCPGLKMQRTIVYEPMPSHKLCTVDTIKVPITSSGGLFSNNFTHCLIDSFTEVPEEADDNKEGA
jgi:hypothetical protein